MIYAGENVSLKKRTLSSSKPFVVGLHESSSIRKKLRVADDSAKKSMNENLQNFAERLDNLIGIRAPNHLSAMDRLRIGVDGVFLMHEEMLSLQVCFIVLLVLISTSPFDSRGNIAQLVYC